MAMRLGERVKPLLLATLLTFMVGSYFVSDTFTRGASFHGASSHHKIVAQAVCASRPSEEHAACYASVAEALVPTSLACTSTLRDLFVCKNPTKGTKKRENSCQEETKRCTECLEVHLEPQLQRRGFSSEEIARLRVGNQDPTKQHPAPPDGREGEGQGGKGEISEGDAAGGEKAEIVPEQADGDGGGAGPKVEVVEGPKDGDGIAR